MRPVYYNAGFCNLYILNLNKKENWIMGRDISNLLHLDANMDSPFLELFYTLGTIDAAAEQFWQAAAPYHLLAFSGEMGAGKTTFIHKLCDYLKVEDTVSSPTFALVNEYHFTDGGLQDNIIYHLDWYRLKNTGEAIDAGMEDCILQAAKGNARCFVEWPEKAKELLQPPYLWISIETVQMGERKMLVTLINE
jgi:tRNA threonylcarbamoyladenosine biosynthesis protein TsaE